MTTTTIRLTINLQGRYCNHWPRARISVNDDTLFDGEVEKLVQLDFTINAQDQNRLCIEHYGKQFGEGGIYDCTADQSQDCVLTIKDIQFEHITIGKELMSKLFFKPSWTEAQRETMTSESLEAMSKISCANEMDQVHFDMNFNGILELDFELPILNWLTIAKYKIPVVDGTYFSNYSLRWHYEEDLKVLKEIKKLLNP